VSSVPVSTPLTSSLFVTVSPCHCVTVSLCHCVIVSLCHCVTVPEGGDSSTAPATPTQSGEGGTPSKDTKSTADSGGEKGGSPSPGVLSA